MSQFRSDEGPGYTWEGAYERTWDDITEEGGTVANSVQELERKRTRERLNRLRRRLRLQPDRIRRGMMRHLYIVLDLSACMEMNDMRPSRLEASVKLLEQFIGEFFDQNPISQLGIIATRAGRAERISELGGNPRRHVEMLSKLPGVDGEPSLQNALDLARQTLRAVPAYTSREVVVIMGSLTSCDPGNIAETIEQLKKDNVTVSIIGLAAAVKVCQTICTQTQGSYGVVLDETHFKELLFAHLVPPPAAPQMECSLMCMGFPHREETEYLAPCSCHDRLKFSGYCCPRCGSRYCEVPTECVVCGLTLVSSPHIARSYRHLFPPPAYEEVKEKIDSMPPHCTGCVGPLSLDHGVSRCPECRSFFCINCDEFVHDTLHSCPGCCEVSADGAVDINNALTGAVGDSKQPYMSNGHPAVLYPDAMNFDL
eukprot:comp19542_c0_seq1/m.22898 comp19542_c0_seq1/g.22898  ORF comp19542_c0_seq1/g.22898 comp19542_c0_seq1/m.22898 type:complete len:426 (-) comp19542_c0_seq1:29-1306(-)